MLEYIEILDSLDKSALLALNGNANPYWDKFMWIITGRFVWIPIIVFFLKYFFNKGYKDAILILLFIILTITLCDQISSSFFKPFFERLRPARQPELTDLVNIVNGYRGGRYGFISSHAANAFGFTVFTSLVFKRFLYTITFILWALLVCYSRVYLGVHFPGDIIGGIILGIICGYGCYKLYKYAHFLCWRYNIISVRNIPYTGNLPKLVLLSTYLCLLIILMFSNQLYPLFIKH